MGSARRDFVDEKSPDISTQTAREVPRQLIPKMAEMGLFGATISDYGLPGLNHVAYGLIMQELERGDSGIRSFASVQSGLVMYPINTYGSQQQRDYWIPKLASGEKIGCFGLTEPDFGSNPGGMRTNARRDGNEWVLNGAKSWITNGSVADVAVVWAKADGNIRGFLVEKGTPGFTTAYHMGKFSRRASCLASVLQDCRILPTTFCRGANGSRIASFLTQAR